jgi:hypothetical protein
MIWLIISIAYYLIIAILTWRMHTKRDSFCMKLAVAVTSPLTFPFLILWYSGVQVFKRLRAKRAVKKYKRSRHA